jgi:hypothetical protein
VYVRLRRQETKADQLEGEQEKQGESKPRKTLKTREAIVARKPRER